MLHRGGAERIHRQAGSLCACLTQIGAAAHSSPALEKLVVIAQATLNLSILHRGGAEEARGAHNPEVVGSNPISGIFQFASFTEVGRRAGR